MNEKQHCHLDASFYATGIRAYDSCGHRELSKIHLMDMFSELETGISRSCSSPEVVNPSSVSISDLRIPGVIDVTGVSFEAKVSEVTRENFISILPMNMKSALPADVVAKILSQVMRDVNWTRIAIVHSTDEHSLQVVKLLTQGSINHNDICFSAVESLPEKEKDYVNVFKSIASKIKEERTPVFVIGFGESIKQFSKIMIQEAETSSRFQWFFASMPDPAVLYAFGPQLNHQKIYGLTPFPGKFAKFEEHWKSLQEVMPGPLIGSWFDEFVCHLKGNCVKSHDFDRTILESEGEVLWRTYQVMPIIHAIFTFSHALRNAWMETCGGVRGVCPAMRRINRHEFISKYLEPLLDNEGHPLHSRDSRRGDKSESIGKLNWKLAFSTFYLHDIHGLEYDQLMLYDSFSNDAQQLNLGIKSVESSICPSGGCQSCVKLRQGRFENPEDKVTTSASSIVFDTVPLDQCSSKCSSCMSQWSKKSEGTDSSLSSDTISDTESMASTQPAMSVNFRRTWGIITAVSSGIGVICVLVCALYFFMVFPVKIGTTILGYMILFGLLILYSVNFLFVLPPSNCVCWLRKIGMSLGYCTVLAGMLVKVMNTWRRMANKNKTRSQEIQVTSPLQLILIAGGLVFVHVSVTLVWLNLFPPKSGYYSDSWRCYPPSVSGSFFVDTESVVSLLYLVFLVGITLLFCFLTWKCHDNNREPRFIFYCCTAIAIVWITWAFVCIRMKKQMTSHHETRDVTIICANLASASLVMILLYLRKLYWYSRIKRKDRLIRSRLQAATFPANFYGALHSRGSAFSSWDAMSYASGPSTATSSVRGSITSLRNGIDHRQRSAHKRPFEEDDAMDDGTMSCGSAASSVQVQGTDLYPMDVYDGGSQFQPSSLFHAVDAPKTYTSDD